MLSRDLSTAAERGQGVGRDAGSRVRSGAGAGLSAVRGRPLMWLLSLRTAGLLVFAAQAVADDLAGQVEDGGVAAQDEAGVGVQDDAVQLEREQARVLT